MSGDKTGLVCDFIGGAVGHRQRAGGGRGQALARAAGFTKGRTPTLVDATTGLGRAAFLLASLARLVHSHAACQCRVVWALARLGNEPN